MPVHVMPTNSDHCNTVEAAKIIGISAWTLRGWRHEQREGQPPFRKVGVKVIYSRAALEKWLTKNTKQF